MKIIPVTFLASSAEIGCARGGQHPAKPCAVLVPCPADGAERSLSDHCSLQKEMRLYYINIENKKYISYIYIYINIQYIDMITQNIIHHVFP